MSFLFPKKLRKYVYSIYSFARIADDIADSDNILPEEKMHKLNELEMWLNSSLTGNYPDKTPINEILMAVSYTVKTMNISINELYNLLNAFKQDVYKLNYYSFSELIEYSDKSANPIGHMILNLFGYTNNSRLFELSDKICTALQLINFWQDVSIDIKIKRVYIPEEIMKRYGYNLSDLYNGIYNENFRMIMKELNDKSREMMLEGMKLSSYLKGRLRYEVNAICRGGLLMIKKIENINYNVINNRPYLNRFDKMKILFI